MERDIIFNPAHRLFDVWAWPNGRSEPPVLLGAAQTSGDGDDAADAYRAADFAPLAAWRVLAATGGTPYTPRIVRGQPWAAAVLRHQRQRLAAVRAIARPARTMGGLGGIIAHLADGATWGPQAGHPCRLIVPPRALRDVGYLRGPDLDAIGAREAELRTGRRAA